MLGMLEFQLLKIVINILIILVIFGFAFLFKKQAEYVENLKKDDVNVKLITGKGLFHIYPLFPIPEAKKAIKKLCHIRGLKSRISLFPFCRPCKSDMFSLRL